MAYKHFAIAMVFILLTIPTIAWGRSILEPCDLESVEGNICLITREAEKQGVDVETALAIAKCESGIRHYDEKKGGVLKGIENPLDTGIFQVNLYYHGATAKKLGYDLYDKQDNITYAIKEVMAKDGFSPWYCWSG
jgi:hypothetical protein